jgi:hypothetical protein
VGAALKNATDAAATAADNAVGVPGAAGTTTTPGGGAITNHRRARKKTVREEALVTNSQRKRESMFEGANAGTGAGTGTGMGMGLSGMNTPGKGALPVGKAAIDAAMASTGDVEALKVEVGRVRSQNLTYINELNERNGEITSLRKREQVLEATLKAKEKMYEQDATVRMQLGRRLEQILLDKEEYKDEIDEMKEHILSLEMELVRYRDSERESVSASQVQVQVDAGTEKPL